MTPSLERYVADLPAGLASHPECQVKGAALRSMLDLLGDHAIPELPFVAEYRAHGVLPSVWYPEVHLATLALAARAYAFPTDAALLDRVFDANLEMFQSKLYYRLMALLSPGGLLKRGPTNWLQFHRGTRFVVHEIREREAQASLEFPARLFGALHARIFAKAFEAALHFNGATAAKLEVESLRPTEVRYRATW